VITSAQTTLHYGETVAIGAANADPGDIASVVLVRNGAITHLEDGDLREVVLPITQRGNGTVTIEAPASGKVAPPGPYMLFINKRSAKGLVPSVAKQVFVGGLHAPSLPITGAALHAPAARTSAVATGKTPATAMNAMHVAERRRSPRRAWPVAAAGAAILAAAGAAVPARRRRRRRRRNEEDHA